MILTCPECATRYHTKAEAVGKQGRTVRCANCDATWFVSPDADMLDLSSQPDAIGQTVMGSDQASHQDANSELGGKGKSAIDSAAIAASSAGAGLMGAGANAASAIRDKTDRKRTAKRIFSVVMLWLVTLAILCAAALCLYLFRQKIVERWPASASVYKAFNIDVAQGGLVFGEVITRSAYIEGTLTVLIEGKVRNADRNPHATRFIRLSLHSPSGQELTAWTEALEKTKLEGAEQVSFLSQYESPPVDAVNLQYQFTAAPIEGVLMNDVSQPSFNSDGGQDQAFGEQANIVPLHNLR